jgi:uncharacterized delta-60 repeat protein
MIFMAIVAVSFLFGGIQPAYAKAKEDWVARYNGPGNEGDSAADIIVDAAGNVYVAGGSTGSGTSSDYATIKYNKDGSRIWVRRYDGPSHGSDGVVAMAMDASGNICVAGTSTGSGTGWDYATIKYNNDGSELWVARFDGGGIFYEEVRGMAVDATGNVYVTGFNDGSGTYNDYTTIKYSTDGSELWVRRYDGPLQRSDDVKGVAVDGTGNVYVTGESVGSGTGVDYATVKYRTDGSELWVRRYDGPSHSVDRAHNLTVDATGNIYVTGYSEGGFTTVKYNGDGTELWVRTYIGPVGGDTAFGIAVDATGHVYVTGRSPGAGTGHDIATVKYNGDGSELWVRRYNGPANGSDQPFDIAIDSTGNVSVTGWSTGIGSGWDWATIKYSSEGNEIWVARYNGPGNGSDLPNAVSTDSKGYVYVAGRSPGSGGDTDFTTIRYSQAPIIISTVPRCGSTGGSGTITIIGHNFDTTPVVLLGDVTATDVQWIESTRLLAGIPPHAAGYVDVTVIDPEGERGDLPQAFLYVPPPVIDRIFPESGSWRGGTGVTITGSNFWVGASVFFGNVRAHEIQVVDSHTILAVTRPMWPGTVLVEVRNPAPCYLSSLGQATPIRFTSVPADGHDGGCNYMPGGTVSPGQILFFGICILGMLGYRWKRRSCG